MSRKSGSRLQLTRRALRDISDILDYSTQRWDKQTADKYVDDLERGLDRLKANPELLRPEPDFQPDLRFYRVNKHLIVCDVWSRSIVVLAVVHASMDLSSRLAELQPTLAGEVEMLHRTLRRRKRKRS